MMRTNKHVYSLLIVVCLWMGTTISSSFVLSPHKRPLGEVLNPLQPLAFPSLKTLRGGGDKEESDLRDFSAEASGLFGNIRIPAALFAGASAGSAFAMPINMASEGLKVGLVKRIYSFLLVGALSSEIIAVVVSTLAVANLATKTAPKTETRTLSQFITANCALAWVSARFHFLSGILWFVTGLGLRAWVTIGCPVFSYAALGMISSATMLCIAFIQDFATDADIQGLFQLPFTYVRLFFQKSKSNPFFAVSFCLYALTSAYVMYKSPHVWQYLATN